MTTSPTARRLFYSGTLQDLTIQAQTSRRLGNPDQWIILPFPGPDGSQTVLTYGPSFGILAASPEEQLAVLALHPLAGRAAQSG